VLTLRPTDWSDARLLWEWANDAEVRRMAFHSEPIAWESHVEWFAKKMADAHCLMLVASDEAGCTVGQIRFDIDPTSGEATVGLSISPSRRGEGLGTQMIKEAIVVLLRDRSVGRISAFIKSENVGSQRAFAKAEFKRGADTLMCGVSARTYFMEKEWTLNQPTSSPEPRAGLDAFFTQK
jgi:RimJ/RimL family protein N-acetyltransferase